MKAALRESLLTPGQKPIRASDLQRACFFRRPTTTHFVAYNVVLRHGECDFIAVLKTGFFHEFEIKVSRADFVADLRKKITTGYQKVPDTIAHSGYRWEKVGVKKHDLLTGAAANEKGIALPKFFWFVAPVGVLPLSDLPTYCGLLEADRDGYGRVRLYVTRPAPKLTSAKKLEPMEQVRIMVNQQARLMWKWAYKED